MDKHLQLTDLESHIWSVSLSQTFYTIAELRSLLTPEEQNRANRYKLAKHQQAFITSRAYLRIILSRYLHISPQDIEFQYSDKGKPYLPNHPQLQFNLSHSQDLTLYALIKDRNIGIDLEYLRDFPSAGEIAQRFFSPQEAEYINNCPLAIQSLAFFQGWTSKEAILKATGQGIADGLATTIVEVNPHQEPRLLSTCYNTKIPQQWFLRKITPQPGYLAIIATNARIDYKLLNINNLEQNNFEIS